MRLHIEGHNTEIAAYVIGWIAECLEDLNAAHHDVVSAVVVLKKHQRQTEAWIQLVLVGKTLSMSKRRKTQGEAVQAALRAMESQLDDFRTQPLARHDEPSTRVESSFAAPLQHREQTG